MATAEREHTDALALTGVLLGILWLGPLAVICAVAATRRAARAGRPRPRFAGLALVLGLLGTGAWVAYLLAPPLPATVATTSAVTTASAAYVPAHEDRDGDASSRSDRVADADAAADAVTLSDSEPEGAPLVNQTSALLDVLPVETAGYATGGYAPTTQAGALEAYRARFVAPTSDAGDVIVTVTRWGTTDEASAHAARVEQRAAARAGRAPRTVDLAPGTVASRVVSTRTATYLWADFTTTVEITGERVGARAVARGVAGGRS